MQITRKSSFTTTPWKNGGGITHEALRVPANGPFRWRLSVAEIGESGPFSDFAGYDRQMALLRGDGVCLTFSSGQKTYLREPGDLVHFDGALSTECELLGGPCVDLNLMVSQSLKEVKVWVERLAEPVALDPARTGTTLIFVIEGAVSISNSVGAARPGGSAVAGSASVLEPWDLATVPAREACALSPPEGEGATPLVFYATLEESGIPSA